MAIECDLQSQRISQMRVSTTQIHNSPSSIKEAETMSTEEQLQIKCKVGKDLSLPPSIEQLEQGGTLMNRAKIIPHKDEAMHAIRGKAKENTILYWHYMQYMENNLFGIKGRSGQMEPLCFDGVV